MKQIGQYKISEKIGERFPYGFYRAHHVRGDGPYRSSTQSILIREFLSEAEGYMGTFQAPQFQNEMLPSMGQGHPNVESLIEWDLEQGYFVQKLVEGWPLDQILSKSRVLTFSAACFVLRQVCEALGFLHDLKDQDGKPQPCIHWMIRPQTIYITTRFEIMVGHPLFCRLDEDTLKGKTQATPEDILLYLPPESLSGQPYDQRSDIYQVGLVLYEMIAGQRYYDSESPDLLRTIRDETRRPPSSFRSEVPEALDAVVMRALYKNPDSRQPTAQEFHWNLELIRLAMGWDQGKDQLKRTLKNLKIKPQICATGFI